MYPRLLRQALPKALVLGLALVVAPAYGQDLASSGDRFRFWCPPRPCPAPERAPLPGAEPTAPTQPVEPTAPALAPESFAALPRSSVALPVSNVGYIDSAVPANRFRFRFDAAYDDNRPDRAEFFYAKCGCFRTAPPPLNDPKAPGPRLTETSVDYQDLSAYLEVAFSDRISGFVEAPVRFLNPEQNANTAGFADMNVGFKFALLAGEEQYATFQFRTFIPTGDSFHGLGTDHVSLEPAILVYQRLTDRLAFEAELRDWIPIGGTDFAGNVLRYGAGLSYDLHRCSDWRITPVAELVGWTVLSGKESFNFAPFVQDASGDTIVNAKVGSRLGIGEHSDLYVGYGRALTGAVWYKDILRVEYRLSF